METTTTQDTTTTNPRTKRSQQSAESAARDPREVWQEASSALSTLYEHAASELEARIQERPYAALAVAAGVGFVLGGGLRSITGRMLLRTTAQYVLPGLLGSLKGHDE